MAQKRNNVYSNWAKSFGKSVKFGAKEILSEVAPSMADTVGSMAEEMRELLDVLGTVVVPRKKRKECLVENTHVPYYAKGRYRRI